MWILGCWVGAAPQISILRMEEHARECGRLFAALQYPMAGFGLKGFFSSNRNQLDW
jgi:hypothetical protein